MQLEPGRRFAVLMCLLLSGSGICKSDVAGESPWYDVPLPDQSDWSSTRIRNYAMLEAYDLEAPQAVVRVPSLGVAVPVYPDSEKMALEAGAAWVTGTARPGTQGNIAIAGHRDSFFRPLESIPIGTHIQLSTPTAEQTFAVTSVRIVDALDVTPLSPSESAVLTLITCHPFRYQGYAPDRYIIQATLVEQTLSAGQAGLLDSAVISGQQHQLTTGANQ